MEKDEAFDPSRPFTRAQGRAAGLTDRALRGPRFRRYPFGGYVAASVPDSPLLCAQAALLFAPPGSWASHATAARVHGCPLPALPDEHVSIRTNRGRPNRRGLKAHLDSAPALLVERDGTRLSGLLQCFVELASQLGLIDLVLVGDWMVRRKRLTPRELREFCAGSQHPSAKAAQRAAAYVRERVDSPMETRLRMLIVLAGLPEPDVNLTIRDVGGEPVRRYDLCWPGAKVIVEYDGREHVERIEQWEKDLARREAIDDEGWRILVVIADGVYKHPEQTLTRIHRLLRARRLSGVPRRLREDWRGHFPGWQD